MNPDSSRASSGSRPKRLRKASRPTSVRNSARTSAGTGSDGTRPWARFQSPMRLVSSTLKSVMPG